MAKQKVFMTGATGTMGFMSLKEMIKDRDKQDIVILVRDSAKNRKMLKPYLNIPGLEIVWGDLNDYEAVKKCVKGADIVLHIGALVSPKADYYPQEAMRVNYGSTKKIIRAIHGLGQAEKTKLVYIGTVAETGDRRPPIHWGRVGDPIKPSMFDYYAVSKVAAERLVIESGLKYWVSLRQTGIIGPAMSKIQDAIIFHNCFDNVLEYCSDRDSARAMKNLCSYSADGSLDESFWGHIYNIGGGPSCRVSTYDMYKIVFGAIGIKNLDYIFSPKTQATKNFHGHYYLDSDILEHHLHFRHDSMQYFYDSYLDNLGFVTNVSKAMSYLPEGEKMMASFISMKFDKLAKSEHGTVHFIEANMEDRIEAYWGSKKEWEALPKTFSEMKMFSDWDKVVHIDHGYDEGKPESELSYEDMKKAAEFRGGKLISPSMKKGDWSSKLEFECAFGHHFKASPRLVLEGGHWCDECERKSWNYGARAKVDPFFAQVWNPIHNEDEMREYPKIVSELDVK